MISSARLAILVPARGTSAFRPLIPGATSSSPLLIDPPTPSSESWSGIEAVVGPANFYERVTDGLRAWQGQEEDDAGSAGRC